MTKKLSMNGEKYGELTVLSDAIYPKGTSRKVTVLCSCGTTKDVFATSLRCGDTSSCGCKTNALKSSHGKSGTQLYRTWTNMKSRCDNPNAQYYSLYGGRGITYCKDWEDFESFYNWAVSSGYDHKLTLDRIDTDGNYEPSNCRFASRSTQQYNRRGYGSSKYSGVHHVPTNTNNPWTASIKQGGKTKVIGSYPTEIDAAKARDDYVKANGLPNTINF